MPTSSCSPPATGLGAVSGDGVIGLARAFLYAGTPSVVATLWDVADEPAARLMPSLYRSLTAGAGYGAGAAPCATDAPSRPAKRPRQRPDEIGNRDSRRTSDSVGQLHPRREAVESWRCPLVNAPCAAVTAGRKFAFVGDVGESGLAAAGGREQTQREERSHKDSSPFEEAVRLDGNRRIDRRMAMRSSGPGCAFMGPEAECFRPSECPTSCAMVSPTR